MIIRLLDSNCLENAHTKSRPPNVKSIYSLAFDTSTFGSQKEEFHILRHTLKK